MSQSRLARAKLHGPSILARISALGGPSIFSTSPSGVQASRSGTTIVATRSVDPETQFHHSITTGSSSVGGSSRSYSNDRADFIHEYSSVCLPISN